MQLLYTTYPRLENHYIKRCSIWLLTLIFSQSINLRLVLQNPGTPLGQRWCPHILLNLCAHLLWEGQAQTWNAESGGEKKVKKAWLFEHPNPTLILRPCSSGPNVAFFPPEMTRVDIKDRGIDGRVATDPSLVPSMESVMTPMSCSQMLSWSFCIVEYYFIGTYYSKIFFRSIPQLKTNSPCHRNFHTHVALGHGAQEWSLLCSPRNRGEWLCYFIKLQDWVFSWGHRKVPGVQETPEACANFCDFVISW